MLDSYWVLVPLLIAAWGAFALYITANPEHLG